MTEPLSPAALAVWQRYCGILEEHGPARLGLAAALRAAADQVVPEEAPPADFLDHPVAAEIEQRQSTRQQLLAIAAKLEGSDA